jgi:tetratricopeptide (TPR) repeat protein
MYLRGSKWSMKRRQRRSHPFLLAVLVILIGAAIYMDRVVVPQTPPLFLPTPTATRDPASFIAEGQTMFSSGKIAKAIEAYKQAVQANGTDVSTYITLAQLQLYNHQYADALSNTGNALLLAPTNSTAKALMGYSQYMLADPKAEATLLSAIEEDPNNPLGHAFYAELIANQIQEQGQVRALGINEAINEAHKAIDLGPNIIETHRAYGFVLLETNNFEKAITEYQAAIAINPNIADLYTGLGLCYKSPKVNQPDQAIESFLKAIPLNPSDPEPDIYLAQVYNNQGKYPMAIQYAELAMKNDPTNPHRYAMLGVYLRRNQQWDQAVTQLEMAIKGGTTSDGQVVKGLPLSRDTQVSLYYAAYGIALADLKRCTEAMPVAQAILQAMPDDENAIFNATTISDKCKQAAEGTFTPTPGSDSQSGSATPAP